MQEEIRIANLNQKSGKAKKDHVSRWEAFISRGKYIDLQMNSPRSIRVYCEHKIESVKMLTESAYLERTCGRSLTKKENTEALKWIRQNQSRLNKTLDLRTYNQLASIMIRRANWQKSAEVSFLS
jgi:hypothetical protein